MKITSTKCCKSFEYFCMLFQFLCAFNIHKITDHDRKFPSNEMKLMIIFISLSLYIYIYISFARLPPHFDSLSSTCSPSNSFHRRKSPAYLSPRFSSNPRPPAAFPRLFARLAIVFYRVVPDALAPVFCVFLSRSYDRLPRPFFACEMEIFGECRRGARRPTSGLRDADDVGPRFLRRAINTTRRSKPRRDKRNCNCDIRLFSGDK